MALTEQDVCAVIVTYGNRFVLLEKVLKALEAEKVGHVVVVSNGAAAESTEDLMAYFKNHKSWLTPVLLSENSGSAGGYTQGLQAFAGTKQKLAWLLDDDNMPLPGSLKKLLGHWNTLSSQHRTNDLVVVSFRKDRSNYQKAVQTKQPNLVLGTPNAFLGIHLGSVLRKLIGKRSPSLKPDSHITIGPIDVAPYGGMLMTQDVIDLIGYPNEAYYLYGDDLEFSYRLTQEKGQIMLALDSLIEDIDQTWHLAQKGSKFMKRLREHSQFRLYYSVRNRIHFDRTKRVTNFFVWYVNLVAYTLATVVLGILMGRWHNVVTYSRALRDGLSGTLGINTHYQLP